MVMLRKQHLFITYMCKESHISEKGLGFLKKVSTVLENTEDF